MPKTVSDNLYRIRVARDMTKSELARKSGLGNRQIGYWEAEKGYPNLRHAMMLAKALGCRVQDFVEDVEIITTCEVGD